MLETGLDVGWIAKIGRYTVHSTLKSWGEVRSHFRASMTPDVDVIVTGELDHTAHTYRFGLGLEWESGKEKEKPKKCFWTRFAQRLTTFMWRVGTMGVSEAK
jgi:hypothetical protein